jgi:hypothetical protein
MGKATITGGGTDGLYQIRIDYGTDRAAARIAAIDARLADLGPQIDDAQTDYDMAFSEEDTYLAAVAEANRAYVDKLHELCTPEGWDRDPLEPEYTALVDAYSAYYDNQREKGDLTEQLKKKTKEIAELRSAYDSAISALQDARTAANTAAENVASKWFAYQGAVTACRSQAQQVIDAVAATGGGSIDILDADGNILAQTDLTSEIGTPSVQPGEIVLSIRVLNPVGVFTGNAAVAIARDYNAAAIDQMECTTLAPQSGGFLALNTLTVVTGQPVPIIRGTLNVGIG